MRMSQASASENPAPAAGPFTAATTGYGIRRRSTIAWCRTSAPRRTSEGRSIPSSSTPLRNQVTSPPAQKALPAPVTISPRSGARSASQAKATVSSPISSGLIALKASGRSRVSVPISPSTSIRIVFSCGGLMVSLVISLLWFPPGLAEWPAAYPLADGARRRKSGAGGGDEPRRADRPAAQVAARPARRLPLLRPRRRAALRRQGALDPQAHLLPLQRRQYPPHFADRPHRQPRHRQRGGGAADRAKLRQAPP